MKASIKQKLVDCMIDMVEEAQEAKYSSDGEHQNSLWVYNMKPENVDEAIAEVQSRIAGLQVITLSVDDLYKIDLEEDRKVNNIERAVEGFGLDCTQYFNFSTLPIVPHSDLVLKEEPDDVKAATERWGFGILYIRDINETNYQMIPQNFEYCLAKHHSIKDMQISRHWLIVGGSNTTLDLGNYGSRFNPDYYLN